MRQCSMALFSLLLLLFPHCCSASTIDTSCKLSRCTERNITGYEPATALEQTLKDATFYNKQIPPGQELSQTTNVYVGVYVESMSSFKAATMDYDLDMYLAMAWFDQRLKHHLNNPVLITSTDLANQLWQPDLYFVNSKWAMFQIVTTPNFMVLIYKDGLVFKSMRVSATLSCMMDLTRFPLDEQHCPIYIQSYAYVQDVLNLTWFFKENTQFPISYNPNIRLNDMLITGQETEYCNFMYPMFRGQGLWSCLRGIIKMRRLIMFHVLQTYIPTALLVFISFLSLWLDPKSAPARVSLTITTLLTLVSVSNGARQGLPQVSYIKAIDIWLTTCIIFVFLTLLEYTLVSFLISWKILDCLRHPRKDELLNSGKMIAQIARICPTCMAIYERYAKRVDLQSRVLFPTLFIIFVVSYWVYYLTTYLDSSDSYDQMGNE